ncbi:MAG: 2-amino-4-hydroxy-6-hydroxymethyldihydropteridine diphosphokinase [Pseudomonadota bacterium]
MTGLLVAFGANLPAGESDPTSTIQASAADLAQNHPVSIRDFSRIFVTPAWPPGSGPEFVNAVALIDTELPTPEILPILHRVEAKFGRSRGRRWGPRSLDLDFLARGQKILPDKSAMVSWMEAKAENGVIHAPDQLILPHPRMHERAFVLGPAQDVAPCWVHPILGKSISEMFANLPKGDRESIRPVD